jgi:hypothetical protein
MAYAADIAAASETYRHLADRGIWDQLRPERQELGQLAKERYASLVDHERASQLPESVTDLVWPVAAALRDANQVDHHPELVANAHDVASALGDLRASVEAAGPDAPIAGAGFAPGMPSAAAQSKTQLAIAQLTSRLDGQSPTGEHAQALLVADSLVDAETALDGLRAQSELVHAAPGSLQARLTDGSFIQKARQSAVTNFAIDLRKQLTRLQDDRYVADLPESMTTTIQGALPQTLLADDYGARLTQVSALREKVDAFAADPARADELGFGGGRPLHEMRDAVRPDADLVASRIRTALKAAPALTPDEQIATLGLANAQLQALLKMQHDATGTGSTTFLDLRTDIASRTQSALDDVAVLTAAPDLSNAGDERLRGIGNILSPDGRVGAANYPDQLQRFSSRLQQVADARTAELTAAGAHPQIRPGFLEAHDEFVHDAGQLERELDAAPQPPAAGASGDAIAGDMRYLVDRSSQLSALVSHMGEGSGFGRAAYVEQSLRQLDGLVRARVGALGTDAAAPAEQREALVQMHDALDAVPKWGRNADRIEAGLATVRARAAEAVASLGADTPAAHDLATGAGPAGAKVLSQVDAGVAGATDIARHDAAAAAAAPPGSLAQLGPRLQRLHDALQQLAAVGVAARAGGTPQAQAAVAVPATMAATTAHGAVVSILDRLKPDLWRFDVEAPDASTASRSLVLGPIADGVSKLVDTIEHAQPGEIVWHPEQVQGWATRISALQSAVGSVGHSMPDRLGSGRERIAAARHLLDLARRSFAAVQDDTEHKHFAGTASEMRAGRDRLAAALRVVSDDNVTPVPPRMRTRLEAAVEDLDRRSEVLGVAEKAAKDGKLNDVYYPSFGETATSIQRARALDDYLKLLDGQLAAQPVTPAGA